MAAESHVNICCAADAEVQAPYLQIVQVSSAGCLAVAIIHAAAAVVVRHDTAAATQQQQRQLAHVY
jgi:hypothetical protein